MSQEETEEAADRPPKWAVKCCAPACCKSRVWFHNWFTTEWKIPWDNLRDPVNCYVSLAILRAYVAVILFQFLLSSKISTGWTELDILCFIMYLSSSIAFQLSACYGIYQKNKRYLLLGIVMELIVMLLSILYFVEAIISIIDGIITYFNISQVVPISCLCFMDLYVLFTTMKTYSTFSNTEDTQIPL